VVYSEVWSNNIYCLPLLINKGRGQISMKGKIDRSLKELLDDLLDAAKSNISKVDLSNLPNGDEKNRKYNNAIRDTFNFLYNVCYLAAIQKQRLRLIIKHSNESDEKIIMKAIKENKDNIEMLHSILIKQLERELNKGFTQKQALKVVETHNKDLVCKWSKKISLNQQDKNDNLKEKI
jgi:hypothetical protein